VTYDGLIIDVFRLRNDRLMMRMFTIIASLGLGVYINIIVAINDKYMQINICLFQILQNDQVINNGVQEQTDNERFTLNQLPTSSKKSCSC